MSDALDNARAALAVDDDAFEGILTKLRTTRGSAFALEVMSEAANRVEGLRRELAVLIAEHERLTAPPVDDEREALAQMIDEKLGGDCGYGVGETLADAILAAGFRRQGPMTEGCGEFSVRDVLTGAVYRQPNKLIAERVPEMHGNSEVIPGWPQAQGPVTEEWEYARGCANSNGTYSPLGDATSWRAGAERDVAEMPGREYAMLIGRRKAGPWEPFEPTEKNE